MSVKQLTTRGVPVVDAATGRNKYRVRVYDPAKGGNIERIVVGRDEAKEVERQLNDQKAAQRGTGRSILPQRLTLDEIAGDYLAAYAYRHTGERRSQASWRKERTYLETYILPALGDEDVNGLTGKRLNAFTRGLTLQSGESASDSTKTTAAGVLARVLKWAKAEGLVRENKAEDMRKDWGGSVKRRTLIPSLPQVEALASALDDLKPGFGDVCRVLAYTGLRWNELVYVPLHAVDLNRQRIQVLGTASESGGKREVRDHVGKTAAAMRTIVIPDMAMPAVRRLHDRARQGQRQVQAGRMARLRPEVQPVEPEGESFARLVNGDRGGFLAYGTWRRHLTEAKGYTAALGEPITYTAHELRHVAASILVGIDGAPADAIARQMGHSSVEFTRRVYAHLFEQDHDELLRAINARVSTLYANDEEATAA